MESPWTLGGYSSSSSSSRGRRDHVPQGREGTPEQNRVELKSPWRLQQQQQGGGEVARGDVIGQESHSLCVGFSFSIASYISLHYMLVHYITFCITLVKRFVAFVAVFSFSITSFPHPAPSPISPETVTSSSNLFCWFFSVGSTFCSTVSMLQHVKLVTDPSETILISDQS